MVSFNAALGSGSASCPQPYRRSVATLRLGVSGIRLCWGGPAQSIAMKVVRSTAWRPHFEGFEAPFVHRTSGVDRYR